MSGYFKIRQHEIRQRERYHYPYPLFHRAMVWREEYPRCLLFHFLQQHPIAMNPKIQQCIDYFSQKYDSLLKAVLKSNHVRVNREKYIRKLVKRFYRREDQEAQELLVQLAIVGSPMDILDEKQLDKEYHSLRRHYGSIVFVVSFLMTTVPDNIWVIIVSCIVDLYIFQCMDFRAKQKILMLYGQRLDLNSDADSGAETILNNDHAMMNSLKFAAMQKVKSGLGFAAKQVVQRQGPKVVSKLSRSLFMVIRRQFIKWFSIIVAKEEVTMVFDMLIPITCAIISGLVSMLILLPMLSKEREECLKQ